MRRFCREIEDFFRKSENFMSEREIFFLKIKTSLLRPVKSINQSINIFVKIEYIIFEKIFKQLNFKTFFTSEPVTSCK